MIEFTHKTLLSLWTIDTGPSQPPSVSKDPALQGKSPKASGNEPHELPLEDQLPTHKLRPSFHFLGLIGCEAM